MASKISLSILEHFLITMSDLEEFILEFQEVYF